jgi:hypothetical protein
MRTEEVQKAESNHLLTWTPGRDVVTALVEELAHRATAPSSTSPFAPPRRALVAEIRRVLEQERTCVHRLLRPSPPDRPAVRRLLDRYRRAAAEVDRRLDAIDAAANVDAYSVDALRSSIAVLYAEAHEPLVERVARRFGRFWKEFVLRETAATRPRAA